MSGKRRSSGWKIRAWSLIVAVVGAPVGPVITVLLMKDAQGNPPPVTTPPIQNADSSLLPGSTPPLTPQEAAKRINQACTVEMRVNHTKKSEFFLFLNSKKYKEPDNFTIAIKTSALPQFKQIGADNPERSFFGKTIVVAGTVSAYEGQPEIRVYNAGQIHSIRK